MHYRICILASLLQDYLALLTQFLTNDGKQGLIQTLFIDVLQYRGLQREMFVKLQRLQNSAIPLVQARVFGVYVYERWAQLCTTPEHKGLDPYWVLNVSITSARPMNGKPDISPRGERTLAIKSINTWRKKK